MDPRERDRRVGEEVVQIFPIKGIIFDNDGVICDTEELWFRAFSQTCVLFGIRLTEEHRREMWGRGSASLYIVEKFPHLREKRDLIRQRNRENFHGLRSQVKPMPGAIEVIRELSQHFPLGIASSSNTEDVKAMIKRLRLEGCFAHIVGGEQVEDGKGKPNPDIYLETARRMKFEPVECLVVEDSPNGLLAGKRAGMRTVVIPPRGSKADFTAADYHLPNLSYLTLGAIRYLETINPNRQK